MSGRRPALALCLALAGGRAVAAGHCDQAHEELSKAAAAWKGGAKLALSKDWSAEKTIDFDFDGDGTKDYFLVLARTFPAVVKADKGAGAESDDGDGEDSSEDIRRFVAVLLSNKGAPMAVIPKGQTFSAGSGTYMVSVEARLEKNVVIVKYDEFASMGSWWASDGVDRWRYQDGQMRKIGETTHSFHRASGESTTKDTNLLTGLTLETRDEPLEDEDAIKEARKAKKKIVTLDKVRLAQVVKRTKGAPKKVVLSEVGSCKEE